MQVGYVGLGAMGRALAAHLATGGNLQMFDRSAMAMDVLASQGATPAASLAALGTACDCVILCLPRSADVEQVLFGEGGLAATLRPGSIVIDQTSGIPDETRRFATLLADRDIVLLDAPVAGGVPAAIAGAITIMASGPADSFATVLPLLSTITPKVHWCSERVGDAQALKSVNNIINAAYRIATLEIVAVGRALGLSIGEMADRLDRSPARSFMTAKLLPAIAEGRSSTDFALALMVKDLDQAAVLAMAAGAETPVSEVARAMIRMALNMLGPEARLDDVVPFMERISGQIYATGNGPLSPAEREGALALIEGALAASNGMIVLENALAAARMGLDLTSIEPVLASGSAYSHAAVGAFAAARGEAALPDVADGIATLSHVSAAGARYGVPLVMTNLIRTRHVAVTDRGHPRLPA